MHMLLFISLNYLLNLCERQSGRGEEREEKWEEAEGSGERAPTTGSFFTCLQRLRLGWTDASSQELNPSLPCR